ncbi:hypothetical protein OG501_37735 [Streptomyces niveus]|uniref:hypothetical protein n=1 Tax=Streptomyces niveus TaxID=193462 RepID=UPI002E34BE96|nr:hypothetical protein [Streptomyces niveus]
MAMDYAARRQATSAARELLKDRYNDGDDFVDPVPVMYAVRAAAYGYFTRPGEEAPEVLADDVLAALTMMDDARARLDALEHDLLRAARSRDGEGWEPAPCSRKRSGSGATIHGSGPDRFPGAATRRAAGRGSGRHRPGACPTGLPCRSAPPRVSGTGARRTGCPRR